MPPKKTESGAAPAKKTPNHPSYQDMITDAIINLKERNGSSRQALKKYVKGNNDIKVTDNMFDSIFNKALKGGVDKGVFEQPKGPSGGTKLAKKTAKKDVEKKPAAEKKAAPKKAAAPKKETAVKKAAPKKAPTAAKKAAPAKKPAAKKAAAPKKPAAKKADAPAVTDKPTVLTKTKSGRVAKTTATKPAAKKAAPKKAAPKKAAPKAAAA